MGLITKEVEVGLSGKNLKYYENLGYEIPRRKKNGIWSVPRGTKIKVKVEHLTHGSTAKVEIECDGCGRIHDTSYCAYMNVNRDGLTYCVNCNAKLFRSGENSHFWNPNLTDEDRINGRNYPEYKEFIRRVIARDNSTCQCCGKKVYEDAEVHHLNGYSWYIEGRLDETNAILLCSTCHSNYHSLYGKKHSTKEDFEEWFGKTVKLLKYNGVILPTRRVYCIEEDKIYDSAPHYAKEHGMNYGNRIYDVCNHVDGCVQIKGKHLLWYDEYEKMTPEEVSEYVNTIKVKHKTHSMRLSKATKATRRVICITNGEIFDSAKRAQEKYGYKNSCNITACCNGSQKSTGYFIDGTPLQWMYYDDYLKMIDVYGKIIPPKRGTAKQSKVICVTTGKIFDYIKDGAKYYNIKPCGIGDCCRGRQKSAGKLLYDTPLVWMYYEDFLKLPQEEQNETLARNKDSSNVGLLI